MHQVHCKVDVQPAQRPRVSLSAQTDTRQNGQTGIGNISKHTAKAKVYVWYNAEISVRTEF